MSVPTVVIRVEFPAYSDAFNIEVPTTSTVLDVKLAISSVCVGHPRPEGQRVIWRGRYLDDRENICELWPSVDEQRIVHLSVRPSAWIGGSPDAITSPSLFSTTSSINGNSSTGRHFSSSVRLPEPGSNNKFTYVRYKHSQALHYLSDSKLSAPNPPEDLEIKRTEARLALERLGYTWPDILDVPFPLMDPTSTNTLDYRIVTIDGKPYLSLLTPGGIPSPSQVHALKILTYTFSILSLPPPAALPTPTPTVPDTSSVPPHVNALLQQLGLPPLRAVPNANIGVPVQPNLVGAPALPEHADGAIIREIPIRALLAPLLMLVFRTVLLLYFFSPTRTPLLGLCLIAWIMYEMWTHVRIVILRPPEMADVNGVGANGVQAGGAADAAPVAPVAAAPGNHHGLNPPRPGGRIPNAEATRNGQQVQGPPVPRQSNGIIDSLALTNIHDENKLLWPLQQPLRSPEPPTFLHKASSFLSLLTVTLHPEVYNRRRAALRQREGRLCTEMNAIEREVETRNDGEPLSEDEQRRQVLRQQLQLQHSQRTTWVKQYINRVRDDDWIEE